MPRKVFRGLRVRKLADTTDGERVARFHPITGERMLVRLETVGADGFDYTQLQPEPWPLAGIALDAAPKYTRISTTKVEEGRREGWIELEGEGVIHRPGGPPEQPWKITHTFAQAETIVLKTVDGDVRYRVTQNPDKWPDEKNGDLGFGGDVRWFYELEREG